MAIISSVFSFITLDYEVYITKFRKIAKIKSQNEK